MLDVFLFYGLDNLLKTFKNSILCGDVVFFCVLFLLLVFVFVFVFVLVCFFVCLCVVKKRRPWYVLSCLWDVHIKEPLLLIGKSSLCWGNGFPLSLSEWSFAICLMTYNRK